MMRWANARKRCLRAADRRLYAWNGLARGTSGIHLVARDGGMLSEGAFMRRMKLNRVFTLIEPGPVVLVTTFDGNKTNVMTISWTMVLDFTPVFAITTGAWNHSFAALQRTRECVIAIPTVDLLDPLGPGRRYRNVLRYGY
jgi:Flavin reductase like domain